MFSETGNVPLVNHGAADRPLQPFIAFPIVPACVRNHALHGYCTVFTGSTRCDPAVICRARNRASIGVEQYLLGIESQPLFRREGALDSITVNLSNSGPGSEDCAKT